MHNLVTNFIPLLILNNNNKDYLKLKKENLIQILQAASDFNFRSSVIVEKNILFLKRDQLSSTLDIEEMQLMVNDLKENFKTLKDL